MDVSIILLVVMVTWCHQSPVTCVSCTWPTTRTTRLTQLNNVSTLRATKLYVTSMTSRMKCSSQCTGDVNCFYVTMDTTANVCSFYCLAGSYINVSGSVYTVVLDNLQVHLLIVPMLCLSISFISQRRKWWYKLKAKFDVRVTRKKSIYVYRMSSKGVS